MHLLGLCYQVVGIECVAGWLAESLFCQSAVDRHSPSCLWKVVKILDLIHLSHWHIPYYQTPLLLKVVIPGFVSVTEEEIELWAGCVCLEGHSNA